MDKSLAHRMDPVGNIFLSLLWLAAVLAVSSSPLVLRLQLPLLRDDGQTEHVEFLAHKGDDLEDTTDGFSRAKSIIQTHTFRQLVRENTVVEGLVVQWKIVVCLAGDVEDLRPRVRSAVAVFPDADKIVLVVASGIVTDPRLLLLLLAELKMLLPDECHIELIVKFVRQNVTPEHTLVMVWKLLPTGENVVAFCIRECQPVAWPLSSSLESQFVHYTRVVWSFRGKFKGPLLAVAPNDICAELLGGEQLHRCQYPSLVMFDTETVVRLGLPSVQESGMRTWIDSARIQSMVYIGTLRGHRVPDSPPETSKFLPLSRPILPSTCIDKFNVLVVLEGDTDDVTAAVFSDIADIVQDGLDSLGYESRIVYCVNLATGDCFMKDEKVIVLAAHSLASYSTQRGTLAVLEGDLLPSDAVLYNFEHVPHHVLPQVPSYGESGVQQRSLFSRDILKIYASGYTVWDYAEVNVRNLRRMGIRADLVPLGYSSKLVSSHMGARQQRENQPQHDEEFIDVLFLGVETVARQATIRRIRDAGITVVHPNAAGIGKFGAELDTIASKSKIVLSLNAFEATSGECLANISCNHGEWKMPRLARLLANSRFVVSELNGSEQERLNFSGGVVFASPEHLAEICLHYLRRPDERTAIAERGHQMYAKQSEADILRGHIEHMLGAPQDRPNLK